MGLLVGTAGCFNNEEAQRVDPISPGIADFTRYVAVGNSLTAGFADGGLYRDGQLNSYPISCRSSFGWWVGATSSSHCSVRIRPTATNPLPTIVPVAPQGVRGLLNGRPLYTKFNGNGGINNLGVPGIRMGDIQTPGYGSPLGNPYFERLLPDGTPLRTYLQYVGDNLIGTTFFSCFMGNNDALGYATTGGVTPFTTTPLFTANYTALLDVLTGSGRKGVVINIPKVTIAPFFQVVTLTQVLAGVNAAVQKANPGAPTIPALVIESPLAPDGIRATKAGDLLLLSQQAGYATIGSAAVGTKKGPYGLSALNPLSNASVLDAEEVATLNAKIDEYNTILKAQTDSRTLAYVDLSTLTTTLSATGGYVQNGLTFSSSYISGGVFSLDGIHFTPAGYALLANAILKSIGTTYKASIPAVDPTRYRKLLVQP